MPSTIRIIFTNHVSGSHLSRGPNNKSHVAKCKKVTYVYLYLELLFKNRLSRH